MRPQTVTEVFEVLSRFEERPGSGRVSRQPPAKEHNVGEMTGIVVGKRLAIVEVKGAQCV